MHPHFVEQFEDATAIQQIVDFVDGIVCNVGVILVAAWSWNAQVEDPFHGQPQTMLLGKDLRYSLFGLQNDLHAAGYLHVALHIVGKVC